MLAVVVVSGTTWAGCVVPADPPSHLADLTVGPPGTPEVHDDGLVDELELDVDDDEFVDEVATPVAPVSETQVRDLLDGLGRAASVPFNAGVPGLWRFSDDELDGLVPPLTRVINRRPALARAVHNGDQITVALQLSAYAGRRIDRINEARKERERGDDQREAQGAAGGEDARARSATGIAGLVGPNGDRSGAAQFGAQDR